MSGGGACGASGGGACGVTSAFRALLEPEALVGADQYVCDSCGQRTDALRGVHFTRLPTILTLQLKRFRYDFRTGTRHKINAPLSFPTTLDASELLLTPAAAQGGPQPLEPLEAAPLLAEPPPPAVGPPAIGSLSPASPATALPSSSSSSSSSSMPASAASPASPQAADAAAGTPPPLPSQPHTALALAHGAPPPAGDADGDARMEECEPGGGGGGGLGGGDDNTTLADGGGCGGGPPPRTALYELYAVLVHSGSASFGHYYALIKDVVHGEWHEFNDATVRPIKETELQRVWGSHAASAASSWGSAGSAYMLLYRAMASPGAATGRGTPSLARKRKTDEVGRLTPAGPDAMDVSVAPSCSVPAPLGELGGLGVLSALGASAKPMAPGEVHVAVREEQCEEADEASSNPYTAMGF